MKTLQDMYINTLENRLKETWASKNECLNAHIADIQREIDELECVKNNLTSQLDPND